MHTRTRTFVAAAMGTALLGGCSLITPLSGDRDGAPADDGASGTQVVERESVAEAVDPAADLPIARPGRPLMRQIQAALNQRRFDAGPADGYAGPRTVRAIRLFKVARRMEVTDDVTPRLLDELELTQP